MRLALLAAACLLSACVLPGGKPAPKAANPITGEAISTQTLEAPASDADVAGETAKVIGKDQPKPPAKPTPKAAVDLPQPVAGMVDASEDAIAAQGAAGPQTAGGDPAPAKPDEKTAEAKPEDAKDGAPPQAEAPQSEAPPPVPQSPEEAKCLKSGGTWATAGKGSAKACVRATRDAGKSCTRKTQCEGLCLARSGTCAPITPLFGCNDVFEADGRRVTLCLE